MSARPKITFRVTTPTTASPEAVYAVLSDPNTHLVWAGEQAPAKNFRLVEMDAPRGAATVGTRFSSHGAASKDGRAQFRDHSVVVEAEPGKRFGFDTDARLTRPHAKEWHSHFKHRYSLERTNGGATITYRCEVYPQNYVAYWLRPWFRPMVRMTVQRAHRRHQSNLARLAETSRASVG